MRAAAVLGLLLALVGCSTGGAQERPVAEATPSFARSTAPSVEPSVEPSEPAAPPFEYVALGDSYTSGAGTPGSPSVGCRRAPGSYPVQVAAALGATHVDASCSGARTEHVTIPQTFADGAPPAPPQLDAVPATADLVTVGLGFNDRGFLRNIVRPGRDTSLSATRVGAIGKRLGTVLDLVRERAPEAQVVLVGYPQLVPPSGSCEAMPWTPEEYDQASSAFALLAEEMARVATTAGATYVDVATPSAGHDVCAGSQAWVNGARPQPGVAAPFHPFAVEQEAVAHLVLAAVE